ncbi:hypothetical protein RI103_38855 (plasmid) [Paraburkholderia sp. FT54]|uniref:DUF7673 family protein n=1 Tax=Paraburkholderia sp. FT54 TaxID=3074437 RepID=UPI0028773ADB|nr:hypothetical protein [Paraburkholderia sp. FT54]WNC95247.1 hypothetical protein RI103_38855 [Paraburkholderia sp. FT54]
MIIPPQPKTHRVTSDVPEHLLEAFRHTITESFPNAGGGQTPAQRAAEIRVGDRDRGLDSLLQPVDVAEGDTEQAETVAEFLAGLYNGTHYRFDLTALRALDNELFEHCLAALRLDRRPTGEVHGYFAGGEQRWQQIITRWNLDKRPTPAPVHGERYQARYVTNQEAPGYREMTLVVAIDGDPARQLPIELHFSAGDSESYSRDLIDLHRGVGRPREWHEEPLDMKAGELRPQWFSIPGARLMGQ